MTGLKGQVGSATAETAKKNIEEELAEKAPGSLKPFFPCCGGPVGTMEKCICMVQEDQKEQAVFLFDVATIKNMSMQLLWAHPHVWDNILSIFSRCPDSPLQFFVDCKTSMYSDLKLAWNQIEALCSTSFDVCRWSLQSRSTGPCKVAPTSLHAASPVSRPRLPVGALFLHGGAWHDLESWADKAHEFADQFDSEWFDIARLCTDTFGTGTKHHQSLVTLVWQKIYAFQLHGWFVWAWGSHWWCVSFQRRCLEPRKAGAFGLLLTFSGCPLCCRSRWQKEENQQQERWQEKWCVNLALVLSTFASCCSRWVFPRLDKSLEHEGTMIQWYSQQADWHPQVVSI